MEELDYEAVLAHVLTRHGQNREEITIADALTSSLETVQSLTAEVNATRAQVRFICSSCNFLSSILIMPDFFSRIICIPHRALSHTQQTQTLVRSLHGTTSTLRDKQKICDDSLIEVANLKRMVAKLEKDLDALANGSSSAKPNKNTSGKSNKAKRTSTKTAATGASGKDAKGSETSKKKAAGVASIFAKKT